MKFTDMRQDRLAFDREPSARTYDGDGHLHVKQCHISKAMVCPYYGREIPEGDALGLDDDRVYYLLRDPKELERAADTFNGKPLLFDHRPVTSDDHDHDLTVGAISNVRWNPPYLDADLSCWSGPAIDQIENESRKQLSCGYRYTADMTPGTYEGVKYDGVMRQLFGNHVSLVKAGRAGPDVVVGDSALKEIIMPHTAPTRFSAFAQGAVSAYAHTKIAQDAKINLAPLFVDLTAQNFKARKPVLSLGLKGALAGKLAADEDLNDVDAMLDRVEAAVEDLADTVNEAKGGEPSDDDTAEDDEGDVIAFLSGKLSDEDLEKVKAMLGAASAPAAMDDKDEAKKDTPAMDAALIEARIRKATTGMVSKTAMDAEIARARADAIAATTAHINGISDARRRVAPWVGELAMDFDSVEAVERKACDVLGIAHAGKHPDALMDIISAKPKAGERSREAAPRTAMDAAAAKGFDERFGTSRIGHAA